MSHTCLLKVVTFLEGTTDTGPVIQLERHKECLPYLQDSADCFFGINDAPPFPKLLPTDARHEEDICFYLFLQW